MNIEKSAAILSLEEQGLSLHALHQLGVEELAADKSYAINGGFNLKQELNGHPGRTLALFGALTLIIGAGISWGICSNIMKTSYKKRLDQQQVTIGLLKEDMTGARTEYNLLLTAMKKAQELQEVPISIKGGLNYYPSVKEGREWDKRPNNYELAFLSERKNNVSIEEEQVLR